MWESFNIESSADAHESYARIHFIDSPLISCAVKFNYFSNMVANTKLQSIEFFISRVGEQDT